MSTGAEAEPDFFGEDVTRRAMRELRSAEPLVVFVGAGVPASVDLPTWERLLRELLFDTATSDLDLDTPAQRRAYVEQLIGTYSAPFLGSLVRDALPDERAFAHELRNHLYEVPKEHFKTSFGVNFPRALCELLLARIRDGQETILVTTNFDDVLEHTFATDPVIRHANTTHIQLLPRFNQKPLRGSSHQPVYHIHGFLPRVGEIPKHQRIIFSENDYSADWTDDWAHELMMSHIGHKWFFVGMSFQDPHISFYLSQRLRHPGALYAPHPVGVFSLQGKRWRELSEQSVTQGLLFAEKARLRELGMEDVLVTSYYFQDAQLLRELALPTDGSVQEYPARRAAWFEQFSAAVLDLTPEESLERGRRLNQILREVRRLMERNLRASGATSDAETIKVELFARDPLARGLFLIASSESLLLDPRRSRRFPLTRDDDRTAAAVKAFTTGKPGLVEKLRTHEHGRWNGFWATPIMLGAPPWYGLPVGALVICTTKELNETSLRFTIPVVQKDLSRFIRECGRLLDPAQALDEALVQIAGETVE